MYRKNLTMFSKPRRLRACHVLVGWSRVVSLLLPPPPEWRRWCFQLWVSVNLSVRKGFWQDFGDYSQYWSLGLASLYTKLKLTWTEVKKMILIPTQPVNCDYKSQPQSHHLNSPLTTKKYVLTTLMWGSFSHSINVNEVRVSILIEAALTRDSFGLLIPRVIQGEPIVLWRGSMFNQWDVYLPPSNAALTVSFTTISFGCEVRKKMCG